MSLTEMKAVVRNITFKGDRGYTVAKVIPIGKTSPVTIVGNMDLTAGETVGLTGTFTEHARFGRQFKVSSVDQCMPEDKNDILAFLVGGFVKGIGPKTGQAIVARFGEKSREALDGPSVVLTAVPGIGRKKAATISRAWKDSMADREINMILAGWGVSPVMATKIIARHGKKAAAVIRDNPYLLARSVDGIGFRKADAIALGAGMDKTDLKRVEAAIVHACVDVGPGKGHCFLPVDKVLGEAQTLVGGTTVERFLEGLANLEEEKLLTRIEDDIWPAGLLAAETALAEKLRGLADSPSLVGKEVAMKAAARAKAGFRRLAPEQSAAIDAALSFRISGITGGPGTGKTTVVKAIIDAWLGTGQGSVVLAAPTGRAAKRLEEMTGMAAGTVHRVFGFSPVDGWKHNADNPLQCGMLVIDEASMLDVALARRAMDGVGPRTHVVLVGDANQLPSVGPGNVLADIIASGRIPVSQLVEIFRQREDSFIAVNARDINLGKMPCLSDGSDTRFLDPTVSDDGTPVADSAARAIDLVVGQVSSLIMDGADPETIQVLAPMYKGTCGVDALNARLQTLVNPEYPGRPFINRPDGSVMAAGDRVMNLRNDYERMVFNGDQGIVTDIVRGEILVRFDDRMVAFKGDAARNLTLAYATTVHKSQGSEYPTVISVFLDCHRIMLQRTLLYTAMTRASDLSILVASRSAVAACVKNRMIDETRNTALAERL